MAAKTINIKAMIKRFAFKKGFVLPVSEGGWTKFCGAGWDWLTDWDDWVEESAGVWLVSEGWDAGVLTGVLGWFEKGSSNISLRILKNREGVKPHFVCFLFLFLLESLWKIQTHKRLKKSNTALKSNLNLALPVQIIPLRKRNTKEKPWYLLRDLRGCSFRQKLVSLDILADQPKCDNFWLIVVKRPACIILMFFTA